MRTNKTAKTVTALNVENVIETAQIKLTVDETRIIVRAAMSKKPIECWSNKSLVELGILKAVPETGTLVREQLRGKCWKLIESATQKRDRTALNKQLMELSRLDENRSKVLYVLTDLGKKIAEGIAVRVGKQFHK